MKYNRFSLAAIAALVLIGSAAQAADIKIGLVTDVGRVNDRSFNQSAWQGVLEACEQLGGEEGKDCKYIETRDAKDYADNIGQFVEAEFDVVVSVGFALGEATAAAAAENPETFFIGVDQFQGEPQPVSYTHLTLPTILLV